MFKIRWEIKFSIFLVALSAVLYYFHYMIFKDAHHIFLYLIGDIAFVPIEVLLVTLIIHRVLDKREKAKLLKKLNMVIGTFFSEIGTNLLKQIIDLDPNVDEIKKHLVIKDKYDNKYISSLIKEIKKNKFEIVSKNDDLYLLNNFLKDKRNFLLRLLENPNLLEHETFTDLLWAVFHLLEELSHRHDLINLTTTDRDHINGDIKRIYTLLIIEWIAYMKHLKQSYPYLFSLAVRTNPFDPDSSVEVK